MLWTFFTAIMAALVFGLMTWIFRLVAEHVENRRLRLLVYMVIWGFYAYVAFLPLLVALFTGPAAFIVSVLKEKHFWPVLAGACAVILIAALLLPKNDPTLNLDTKTAVQNLTGTHDAQLEEAMKAVMEATGQRQP